jgi:hypothetical protein
LRNNYSIPNNTSEITVKSKDKDSITDRIELSLLRKEGLISYHRLESIFGHGDKAVHKDNIVFSFIDSDTVVTLSDVSIGSTKPTGPNNPFLEVEGKNEAAIDMAVEVFEQQTGLLLKQCDLAFHEMGG